ncbi:thiol:disulfide interchange protein [Avrilella dinanensis]|uniref:Thiol:disulfide interchange protein n=2 Tax=Avrilella dinanensis TaxID=2008672 RepID=A0A2M9R8E8_9FLAO|nr:thiol:disulfide interchange protein [Avrilella dinanensis]
MRVLSIIAFVCFSLSVSAQSKLPNVTLKDLKGKSVNIAQYGKSDKPVIVSFWATWCGPCLKELEAINKVYDKWQKETGVELVAVSIDDSRTRSRVKPLVNGKAWDYTVLLDENQELKRAMNVINPPYTVVVYKGQIVYSHTGYTPGTENELYKELKKAIGK